MFREISSAQTIELSSDDVLPAFELPHSAQTMHPARGTRGADGQCRWDDAAFACVFRACAPAHAAQKVSPQRRLEHALDAVAHQAGMYPRNPHGKGHVVFDDSFHWDPRWVRSRKRTDAGPPRLGSQVLRPR